MLVRGVDVQLVGACRLVCPVRRIRVVFRPLGEDAARCSALGEESHVAHHARIARKAFRAMSVRWDLGDGQRVLCRGASVVVSLAAARLPCSIS